MVVFLRGLPPRLGARNAGVGEVCEVFWQTFPIVEVADALLGNGAILHRDRDPHFMDSSAFVAIDENAILGC